MSSKNPDVFLSRSWNDHKEADEIIDKLKEYGIEPTEDVRDTPYENHLPALAEMVSSADCVIVLLSSRYLESSDCMKEILQLLTNESVAERTIFVAFPGAKNSGHYVEYWRREKEKLANEKKKASSEILRKSIAGASRTIDAVLRGVEGFFAGVSKSSAIKLDRLKKSCEPLIKRIAWESPELALKVGLKLNVEEIIRDEQKRLRIIARNKIRSLKKRSIDSKIITDKTALLNIPLKSLSVKEGTNRSHKEIAASLEKIANWRKPVMIFGESGQGKTVLATLIAEKILDSKKRIPYFASVHDISACSETSDIYKAILIRNEIDGLHPETLKKIRFCFIIDDCQILDAEAEKRTMEAVERLSEEGHHVALFSDFNARFPAPAKPFAHGWETIIIDSEKIAAAKMTDRFIETRFSGSKEIKLLKAAVRKYDASMRGSRQNLLLLTSILYAGSKYPKTIKNRVGDSGTLKKILNGGVLSKFELYDAFTDYIVGKEEIKSKRNVKSRKDKKEKLARKAFKDIFDPENSSAKGLKSSLLYKNGKRTEFVHDSLREFFLAAYFAERINSGKLSVGKAYEEYWTYVEEPELWNLPEDKEWRALLPDWKTTLEMISERLASEKRSELIAVIKKNYSEAARLRTEGEYNPFAEDRNMALRLAARKTWSAKKAKASRQSSEISRNASKASDSFSGAERNVLENAELARSREDSFKMKTADVLGELGYYDPKLSRLLKDENWEVRKSAVEAFAKIGRYDPQLIKLLRDGNFYVRRSAAGALGKIKHYDPELVAFLKDENPEIRSRAANILGEIRRYSPELSALFEDENAYVRWSVIDALGKMKRYDAKITTALGDENIGVRQRAAEALKETAGRKVIEDYRKLYGLEERVMELSVLKDVHQAIKPSGRNPFGKEI